MDRHASCLPDHSVVGGYTKGFFQAIQFFFQLHKCHFCSHQILRFRDLFQVSGCLEGPHCREVSDGPFQSWEERLMAGWSPQSMASLIVCSCLGQSSTNSSMRSNSNDSSPPVRRSVEDRSYTEVERSSFRQPSDDGCVLTDLRLLSGRNQSFSFEGFEQQIGVNWF